jgi:hypothetical protein
MNMGFLIGDLFAGSPPALVKPEDVLVFSHRIDSWCHAIVKERIGLGKVDNIEGIVLVRSHAFD